MTFYVVALDDNYHYMDPDARYREGEYATLAEALQVARDIVDGYLLRRYRPGLTAEALFEDYAMFGEDPFIIAPAGETVTFSAWDYARQRCREICGEVGSG